MKWIDGIRLQGSLFCTQSAKPILHYKVLVTMVCFPLGLWYNERISLTSLLLFLFQGIRIALDDVFGQEASANGTVVISTYDTFRANRKLLLGIELTAICLDEGHKIRNPLTEIATFVKMLQTPNRIILSGTPIQNSLRELWSLFDFTCPGILGTLQAFESEFATPIRQGGFANASKLQVEYVSLQL